MRVAGPALLCAALDTGVLGTHVLDFEFPQGELIDLIARRAAALP